jgi:16S rRNA processing protein RimM
VRGWVTVTPTTDEPERRFAVGSTVRADRPLEIAEVRFGPRLAVLFAGCGTREDAEALRGLWLHCDVEGGPEDPDEFYDHQLEGLTVFVAGTALGVVREVLHLPGQDILDVDVGGRQVLVPFVEQIVPVVDVAGGRIEVTDVEGLFGYAD